MFDLKKKALGSIKESLGKGMAEELNPKPPAPAPDEMGDTDAPMGGMEPGEGTPMEESQDGQELSDKIPGADVSKLSPEERQQLDAILEKMGC